MEISKERHNSIRNFIDARSGQVKLPYKGEKSGRSKLSVAFRRHTMVVPLNPISECRQGEDTEML
jgi:hypothetical protein